MPTGRKVPKLTTDEDAENFLNQDLSDLDFAQFKPVRFEFEPKSERINMRLPATLLRAVKASAAAEGVPYQRFIRQVLERALTGRTEPAEIRTASDKALVAEEGLEPPTQGL